MQLHTDYTRKAVSRASETEWVASPLKGVDRKMLERNGGEVARATAIVRYAPGSYFSPHVHTGGEEFIVLEGVFSDEHGDYPVGMYVRNPVGSKHKPYSENGCTIMVKLWQFPAKDQRFVRTNLFDENLWQDVAEGQKRLSLHATDYEQVEAYRIKEGAVMDFAGAGGQEFFVVSGTAQIEEDIFGPGDWLRFPAGHAVQVAATSDLLLYVKTGHLSAPPPLPKKT